MMLHPGSSAGFSVPAIKNGEYEEFRSLIKDKLGIHLSPEKKGLLSGRLQKRLRELKMNSFREYYLRVTADVTGSELGLLADQITTNHTFFMREREHFHFFSHRVLPEVTARIRTEKSSDLRVWCAAAATGEEPYTLAMLIREFLEGEAGTWNAGLLATDLSERALEVARQGRYGEERVAELPQNLIQKYFKRNPGGSYEVREGLKADITFRRFNLTNEVYPFKKKFQVIFCRNVMIYFDPPTKERLVRKLEESLAPGGYLFIGHSETLGTGRPGLVSLRPAVYQKAGS